MGAAAGSPGAGLNHVGTSASDILSGEEVDGSIAYEQLLKSDNPYDPKFKSRPGSTGKVTVEPLIPVKKSEVQNPATPASSSSADSSSH
jgi:hypothetical protein